MTRNVAYLLSCALAICLGMGASAAFADDTGEDKQKTYYELQQQIEEKQALLAEAVAESDEAMAAIEANEERIAELEREIPAQQKRSSTAARDLYKFRQDSLGIIDALLSANNFGDFITDLEYMNRVSRANIDEIHRLNDMKAEIDETQRGLKVAQTEAEMRAEDARVAMMAAQEAQAEVQRRIEEEARLQAQIAAEAARMAELERANDAGEPATPETGTVEEPAMIGDTAASVSGGSGDADGEGAGGEGAAAPEGADGSSDSGGDSGGEVAAPDQGSYAGEDAYVAEWAARIDAYLAGSPLAGQGLTFAKAAYEYGVDPRFSPAISFTESGKGAACFASHNAWGWGSASWGSWEEAIYDHVAGLARGYGGQISIEGAQKYCPPNWQAWYDRTLGQMELI